MAFWQSVQRLWPFKAANGDGDTSTLDAGASQWLRAGWGGMHGSLTTLYPQEALTLSAYWACIRAISEDIGKLPLCVYRRVERGKEKATEHPYYGLLHDAPNPDMGAMTFREVLTHFALTWGNAYAWIVRQNEEVVALYPLHPSVVRLRRDPETGRRRYLVNATYDETNLQQATWYWLDQADMLHIKGLGCDGLTGYSVAQFAAASLGLAKNAETFGSTFFQNGAHMSGVFEHPGKLGPEAAKNLRESLNAMYAGPWNAGKFGILEEGMKYAQLGIPPDDAQFLETRQFQIREICRWFRMPPHKIGDLTDAHYQNIEQQNLEYVTDTLQPWLVRWEQELKRKLFDEPSEQDYFAEHNVKGLLRGDHMARATFYKTMFDLGAFTTNMILEYENENPTDGEEGDIRFIAANNLQPLKSFVASDGLPQVAPTQPPPSRSYPLPSNGLAHEVLP